MRKDFWIFALLLWVAGPAAAQSTGQPAWDVNVSAGLIQARPLDVTRGWDDWYAQGRYSASIGRFWTTHFKTEIELAATGEGRQFTQEYVPVPGTAINYPVSVEAYRRLRQGSARAVWQFNDNAWVHPYLSIGAVYEVVRTRQWSPEQFYYPPGDPRGVARVPLQHDINGDQGTDSRVGFSIGGGSKFYFSPSAYFNSGILITRAKPSTTITLLAGLGIDF